MYQTNQSNEFSYSIQYGIKIRKNIDPKLVLWNSEFSSSLFHTLPKPISQDPATNHPYPISEKTIRSPCYKIKNTKIK